MRVQRHWWRNADGMTELRAVNATDPPTTRAAGQWPQQAEPAIKRL